MSSSAPTTSHPAGLTPAAYYDKVLGGWVGKSAGGILGAPIEGYKVFNQIELSDELFATTFANDDLDLQVLWLDMVDRKGPWVREADFTAHWRDHVAFPWNEYGIATRNIRLGLDIPDTGRHDNWYWSQSMGSPIRSEIWGMLFPGEPERAARYARMDSELDHTGFSVHAEQYFSACAALAFVTDDIERVLSEALRVIPADQACGVLVRRVTDWYGTHGFATTAAKIKSYYGDADFTSAPMNVGFTILSMLHAGADFDRIVESLHLGHDSDCVVATAAAILGILQGHGAIPELWKKRVGNALVISPEVTGIRTPATLTELAEWTCAVGHRIASGWPPPEVPLAMRVTTQDDHLQLTVENLTADHLTVGYRLVSPHFAEQGGELSLAGHGTVAQSVRLAHTGEEVLTEPTRRYTIELSVGDKDYRYERGVPDYGAWLLLGPFIREDRTLAPMDEQYPDHGMSSLPSVRYMNHDRVNGLEDEFVTHEKIADLLDGKQRDEQPFGVAVVRPGGMSLDLGHYFHGRGERTLYLTTYLDAEEASTHWLCLGSTGYLTAWVNGREVLRHRELRRRWPATAHGAFTLREGRNVLTIRLDTVVDDYRLDIGIKDHTGKHPHQSHWNTTLTTYLAPAPPP